MLCGASPAHTITQVRGAAEDRGVGRGKVRVPQFPANLRQGAPARQPMAWTRRHAVAPPHPPSGLGGPKRDARNWRRCTSPGRQQEPGRCGLSTSTSVAARWPTCWPGTCTCQAVRPLRGHHRHRAVWWAGRAGDGERALRSATRVFWVVDNGSSHRARHRSTDWRGLAEPAAGAPTGPRVLVAPGRDLPVHLPAEGPDPQRLRRSCRGRAPPARLPVSLRADRGSVAWCCTRADLERLLLHRLAGEERLLAVA